MLGGVESARPCIVRSKIDSRHTASRRTDRFTCRQTDGEDRQTDRQAGKQAGGQAGRRAGRRAGGQAGKRAGKTSRQAATATDGARRARFPCITSSPQTTPPPSPSRYYVSDIPESFPEYLTRSRLNVCYSNRVEIHLIASEDQELSSPSPTCSTFAVSFFFPPLRSRL